MSISKPMLAANDSPDVETMSYPVLASYKTDGIRCLLHPQLGPIARSFKPIPNQPVRTGLEAIMRTNQASHNLDGELVTYTDGELDDFHTIQSKVMKRDGEPEFALLVFDCFSVPTDMFSRRIAEAMERVENLHHHDEIVMVPHQRIQYPDDMAALKELHLSQGHEGSMSRDPKGQYKQGRSTLKQGWLLKHKVWRTAEGIVIGHEEMMLNENEQHVNELGTKVRSTHAAGKVAGGTCGAVILDTDWGQVRVGAGKGLDRNLRDRLWRDREQDLGRTVTFRYMPHGTKDKPRLPGWVGFRSRIDMSDG